jgi:pantothenate kinase
MRVIETDDPVTLICDEIAKLLRPTDRCLIAIAGPPASGKTTLASNVAVALNQRTHEATFFPMDGFHLDNRIPIERDRLVEKGAPDTFDAGGFLNMVAKDHSLDGVGDPRAERGRK